MRWLYIQRFNVFGQVNSYKRVKIVKPKVQSTYLFFRHCNIYFFHILINIETDKDALKWVYFKSSKQFLTFPGVFLGKGSPIGWKVSSGESEEKCFQLGNDCVAIEKFSNSSVATLLDFLDMDTFKQSKNKQTLIKVAETNKDMKIIGKSSWDLSNISFCCSKNNPVQVHTFGRND